MNGLHTPVREPLTSISVVIPFGGHGLDHLAAQLRSVDAAARYAHRALGHTTELVVSVNTHTAIQETRDLLSSLSLTENAVVVDSSDSRGPSHARNVGVTATSGDVILFCDADDVVDERWAVAMVTALQTADLAGGALDLVSLNRGGGTRSAKPHVPRKDWGWMFSAPTSNLAVRRTVYDEAGGFDETLLLGEDKDLCWRAQYNGAEFVTAPDAVVHYRWRPTLRAHFAQTYAWGVGDALLLSRHRAEGLRPEYIAGLKRTARAFAYIAAVPIVFRRRWHAVGAFGKAVGRIVGSLRYRIWAL